MISLLITIIIETSLLFILLKLVFKIKKVQTKRVIYTWILASGLTLPYLWFVLPAFVLSNYYIYIGEFFVFAIESLIYIEFLEIGWKKSITASFICNLSSFLFGLLIFL